MATVLDAQPGERNNRLHWAACRAAEMIAAGQLDQAAAIDALTRASETVGLGPGEINATIASALRNANDLTTGGQSGFPGRPAHDAQLTTFER